LPFASPCSCSMTGARTDLVTAVEHSRQNTDIVGQKSCLVLYETRMNAGFCVQEALGNVARGMLSKRKEEAMVKLKVNGMDRTFDGDPDMPLLWYLRDVLGLTGTKFGCGIALCGACTVHKNGEAIRSCVTSMSAAAGSDIRTIEDLGANGLHPVQEAWMQVNVPQCGYCQSGQIMQAVSLLKSNPHPSDQEIDDAMAGNICRCGTYQRIRKAIKLAAGKNT